MSFSCQSLEQQANIISHSYATNSSGQLRLVFDRLFKFQNHYACGILAWSPLGIASTQVSILNPAVNTTLIL